MTTHSHTPPPPPQLPPRLRTHIAGADDLIAAVPALLGFTPHRSLVLVCLTVSDTGGTSVGTVMRHDVSLPAATHVITHEMADVLSRFAQICVRNTVDAACAVIVDDRADSTVDGSEVDGRFGAIAVRLAESLRHVGTMLTAAYLTSEIVAGGRWTTVAGPPRSGVTADPTTSPVALAYMLDGRRALESRDQLKRTLAPIDTAMSREVAAAMIDARLRDPDSDRVRLEMILAQIATWAAAPPDRPAVVELEPARTADFGVALCSVMVRDSLLAVVLTGFADIAEQLWLHMTRLLPPLERAAAATLLGFSAYARGDGALATLAVDIALDADSGYSLARLLDRSLMAGARPEMIREVALSGYAVAELCGVRLPPPVG